MNIKLVLISFVLSAVVASGINVQAQNRPAKRFPHAEQNCFHLLSNSCQCSWIYYGIKGTMTGTVIACNNVANVQEGTTPVSVSMIKAGRDTIRVLHIASGTHKCGDKVTIVQAREPEQDVYAPYDKDFLMSEEDAGRMPQCRINEYDGRIRKTAWGTIALASPTIPKKAAIAKKPVTIKS